MALGSGTTIGQQGLGGTIKMQNKSRIHFHLDDSYPTGGYTAFSTFVKTILGSRITILDIYQTDIGASGGYVLAWDRSADTLMVYGTGAAQYGPLSQVQNATNLSAQTNVEMIVEWC